MDSNQLQYCMNVDPEIRRLSLGVCANDTLPRGQLRPGDFCLIVNVDNSHRTGSHWQACIRKGPNLYVFCSLGLALTRNFKDFVHRQSDHVTRNIEPLQPVISTLCGSYVVCFLYFLCRKVSFRDFLEKFSLKNRDRNDYLIIQFMRSHFRLNRPKLSIDFLVDKM
jgi:hypothetical protein